MSPSTHAKVLQFRPQPFPATSSVGRNVVKYSKGEAIFSQGETANAIFYIQEGKINLRVFSDSGREAIIALLGVGDFLGEGCLSGESFRTATATAMTDCSVMRLEKQSAARLIREEPAFSELFVHYLLSRKVKIEEDLVDQLLNSSEKRLARVLVQLANSDVIPKISQETLAEMVGTTRSRVSFFMNKFRKLGLVDYKNGLEVHSSLLDVIVHDGPCPAA